MEFLKKIYGVARERPKRVVFPEADEPRIAEAMARLEWDLQNHLMNERRIPEEWHEISTRKTSAKKQLTVRFDEDVVKFFKSAGPGYQSRMNKEADK